MNQRIDPKSLAPGLAFAILLFGIESACLAQKSLAWKFTKNRIVDVLVEQDTKMKLDGLTPSKPTVNDINTIQKTNLTWTIQDIRKDGSVAVEQAISRIVLEMKSPAANFVLDTNDNKPLTGIGESIAKEIRPMAGARFVVNMRPTGEVIDINIPDDLAKKLNASGLAETGFREIAINSSLQLPATPIVVGDAWENQYELDMRVFGTLTIRTTYQYLGGEVVSGITLDKISATTSMRAIDSNDSSAIKLAKQESTGTIWFNNTSGCIDHSAFQQEMALDVKQADIQLKQVVKQELRLKFAPRP